MQLNRFQCGPLLYQLSIRIMDLAFLILSGSCTLYATIKDGHKGATVSLCAGKERKKHVYTSESDNLEIRIVTSDRNKDTVPNFLIQYEGNNFSYK